METKESKLAFLKSWLKTGSINIFGLPMSGKDSVGIPLARDLGGKFISSGLIIREIEKESGSNLTASGNLIPSNLFYNWILPYFKRDDLKSFPLILSSVGRWSGEEKSVIETAKDSGHEIKVAVLLNCSEEDVLERFESASLIGDRTNRPDDQNENIFRHRLDEFREKTMPVIKTYQDLGILIEVNADQTRDLVYSELIEKLYAYAKSVI